MKRSPLLVICVCIWMLLSLTTVEAGYWQRTGGPRILTNADTAIQMNLKVAESAATTKTLMGQEAAVIHWSWSVPPQSFAPGDIIQVNLRYQIAAMVGVHWEGSGLLNAALEMPNVPLGHGTSATVQLAKLDIWPRGTRPGMSNSVTNTTVKAPPQSGDRVIRISVGGAYVGPGFGVEYYYKWMDGTAGRAQMSIETNFDRPGGDYSRFGSNTWEACAEACQNDAKCRAFTWVKPGVQAQSGVCWLKGSIPGGAANSNTVSGIKQ